MTPEETAAAAAAAERANPEATDAALQARGPTPAKGLRRGGSITLPEGATQEDIDNALRQPAAEQETQ